MSINNIVESLLKHLESLAADENAELNELVGATANVDRQIQPCLFE